jgi:serine/threonine-protein kinase
LPTLSPSGSLPSRRGRGGLSLLVKVMLALAAAGLIPLGVIPWLWRLNVEALRDQVLRTHALAARGTAERAAAFLTGVGGAAQAIASHPTLAADPTGPAAQGLLSGLLEARDEVAALALDDATGRELLRVQGRREASAAAELLALPDTRALIARRRPDGLWLRWSLPVSGTATRLRVVVKGQTLDALATPEELGPEALVALFDEEGRAVAGPDASADAFPAAMLAAGRSGHLSGSGRYPGVAGEAGAVLGACAPVPGSAWFVLSRQPARVAEVAAARMQRRSLVALGTALGLVLLLSAAAQRRIIRPLRDVIAAQRRLVLGAGRLRSQDEIAQLRESFTLLEGQARDREALGNVFLGRYLVVDVIASGGMGTVFRGWDPRLQRAVALKTVRIDEAVPGAPRQDLVSSLLQEAVMVAGLNHPHIVAVYDVEDLPEAAFIAMELVEGGSLAQHIGDRGALPVRRLAPLGRAVARGLEAAHVRGVIHRDMKPANVLLGRDGAIKVTDFGIAAMLSALLGPARMVFGTPGYLPPEALRGEGQGVAADLFALGVVLYEAALGLRLYPGDDLTDVSRRTCEEAITPLRRVVRDVPDEFDALVCALLEKEPGRRPGSAGEVAADLERLSQRHGWEWQYVDLSQPTRATQEASRSQLIPTLHYGARTAPRRVAQR